MSVNEQTEQIFAATVIKAFVDGKVEIDFGSWARAKRAQSEIYALRKRVRMLGETHPLYSTQLADAFNMLYMSLAKGEGVLVIGRMDTVGPMAAMAALCQKELQEVANTAEANRTREATALDMFPNPSIAFPKKPYGME